MVGEQPKFKFHWARI